MKSGLVKGGVNKESQKKTAGTGGHLRIVWKHCTGSFLKSMMVTKVRAPSNGGYSV